jgi:hypothetical protein
LVSHVSDELATDHGVPMRGGLRQVRVLELMAVVEGNIKVTRTSPSCIFCYVIA